MTKAEFQKLARRPVLLDGATGSNLLAAGMPRGGSTERWILQHPEVLAGLQRAYVEAGSQIVYTATFGGNRRAMALSGNTEEIGAFNRRLVEITQGAVEGRALVAGDLTTSGLVPDASEEYTYADALELYKEQISCLAAAGVDLLVAETMISVDEAMAAVEAAGQVCDLPILCCLTVEADGNAFSGGHAADGAAALEALGADAVGINCSVGPDQLEAVVAGIRAAVRLPVIAKPNAGMPAITERGEVLYSMGPEDFAGHMERLMAVGATLVGGCCGTTPAYIRCLRQRLQAAEGRL
ncbi:MAG: homocysteine S-methyltransferase family protein [Oscillospiraceae bacterium]|jgi:5-methyltetrahydrofolate--homocysteine methyltransferase|nr:homocysteine S-methyltransferase family protein [Oscillospiraceae bacterium]